MKMGPEFTVIVTQQIQIFVSSYFLSMTFKDKMFFKYFFLGNIDLSAVLSEGCVTETTAPVTTTEAPPVRIFNYFLELEIPCNIDR